MGVVLIAPLKYSLSSSSAFPDGRCFPGRCVEHMRQRIKQGLSAGIAGDSLDL